MRMTLKQTDYLRYLAFSRVHATLYVNLSVSRSVRSSVGPSVTLLKFLPKGYLNCIKAPAHPYATNAVVYTALFLGSGPDRGRSPVEWGDFPYVRPSVRPSPPLGHPARPEAQPARPEA